jgi:hypothetical protein
MIKLLQVCDILQLCPIIRCSSFGTQRMSLCHLLLQPSMRIIVFSALRYRQLHLLLL